MRLFVAIFPPADVIDDLLRFTDQLEIGRAAASGLNTRRTARDLMHITLAFLGDVAPDRLSAVRAALGDAATVLRPTELRLAGGGRFGKGRFSVLWVGVDGALQGPALVIQRGLDRHRVHYDRKPWRPHLTVARPGDRLGDLAGDVAALRDYHGPSWMMHEIRLVSSLLGPAPMYETVASWPLG